MLSFIRERSQGWLAWIIVLLISIPFALWGINSYMGGPGESVVAFVDDEEITQTEFQRAMRQYRERMRFMLGERFDFKLFDNMKIKRRVLDGLIEQKLLLSSGDLLGQTISDTVLSKIIQSTPEFKKDGHFDYEYYIILEELFAQVYNLSIVKEIIVKCYLTVEEIIDQCCWLTVEEIIVRFCRLTVEEIIVYTYTTNWEVS